MLIFILVKIVFRKGNVYYQGSQSNLTQSYFKPLGTISLWLPSFALIRYKFYQNLSSFTQLLCWLAAVF